MTAVGKACSISCAINPFFSLKVGDKVRLFTDKPYELNVSDINGNTFTVSHWTEKNAQQVFVYGKEVPDFRTVDYDQIFTLNVSATQALAQQVEELKQQVTVLQHQNTAFQQQNDILKKGFQSLESRLNELSAHVLLTPSEIGRAHV